MTDTDYENLRKLYMTLTNKRCQGENVQIELCQVIRDIAEEHAQRKVEGKVNEKSHHIF